MDLEAAAATGHVLTAIESRVTSSAFVDRLTCHSPFIEQTNGWALLQPG
jgi:hypothetical protein